METKVARRYYCLEGRRHLVRQDGKVDQPVLDQLVKPDRLVTHLEQLDGLMPRIRTCSKHLDERWTRVDLGTGFTWWASRQWDGISFRANIRGQDQQRIHYSEFSNGVGIASLETQARRGQLEHRMSAFVYPDHSPARLWSEVVLVRP